MKLKQLLTKSLLAAVLLCLGQSAWATDDTSIYTNTVSSETGWTKLYGSSANKTDGKSHTGFSDNKCTQFYGTPVYYLDIEGMKKMPDCDSYTIEFYVKPKVTSKENANSLQTAVYAEGTTPSIAELTTGLLFNMKLSDATSEGTSCTATFTPNSGNSKTATISNTWYHIVVSVNTSTKSVTWTFTEDVAEPTVNVSDTYTYSGENPYLGGIFVYHGDQRIDDVSVKISPNAKSILSPTATLNRPYVENNEDGLYYNQYKVTATVNSSDVDATGLTAITSAPYTTSGNLLTFTEATNAATSVIVNYTGSRSVALSIAATSTAYAKVATFDFTSKNTCNNVEGKKDSETYFGFTQNAAGIRYQRGINKSSNDNYYYTGLQIKGLATGIDYFNLVDGYGIYYQKSNGNGETGTITYTRYNTPKDLKTELVYKTGNSTNTSEWASTQDDYRYGQYSSGYNITMNQGATSYEVYKALNVYAPIATASVQANIGAAGVMTYCAPCALNFSAATTTTDGAGALTAYTGAVEDGKVKLTPVDNVPANTGVILKGTAGATYNIPVLTTASETAKGALTGTNVRTVPANGNNYVLSKENDVVGFYKLPNGGAVQACRAYLTVSGSGNARMMTMSFDGSETTGVKSVQIEKTSTNTYYNLAGQRVTNPTKGLYIMNGKKVVIK